MIDEEKIKRVEDSFAKAGRQLLDCGNRLNDTLNWINTAKPEWWNGKEEIKWK